jgi:hypothetical protein
MNIVGITGPIHHGKTTFAEDLLALEPASVHYETSGIIGELATAWLDSEPDLPPARNIPATNQWLKKLVPIINSTLPATCRFDQIAIDPDNVVLDPEAYVKLFEYLDQEPPVRPPITKENKEAFRPLMQWLGGYLLETVDPGLWCKEIVRRIEHDESNGAQLAVTSGVRLPEDAEVLRGAGATIVEIKRPGLPEPDLSDPTERRRASIKIDTTVINDGNLDQLQACAQQFYQDIQAGRVAPQYQATSFGS